MHVNVIFWTSWFLMAALAGAVGLTPARAAEGNRPPVVTQRMIHVCDCPSAFASDERNDLLQAFAKRGFEQGRNLDLVTYDVTALGTESRGRGPLSLLGKDASGNPYANFLSRYLAIRRPQVVLASGIRAAQGARKAISETPVIFLAADRSCGLRPYRHVGAAGRQSHRILPSDREAHSQTARAAA